MKFAVEDKVVLNTPSQKHWNGLNAVVVRAGSDDPRYPYDVRLLEDSEYTSYKEGDIAESFREDELVSAAEVLKADVDEAVRLLQKHGLAFRIYTSKDVESLLDAYAEHEHDPVGTKTFRAEIVKFIMEGQDWHDLSKKGFDDDTMLWMMVEGARNDHPEWFVN